MLLLFAGIFYIRKNKVIGFSIFWFLITLLPVSNIVPISGSMMAERWLYIPSVGFCIALGGIFERAFSLSEPKRTVFKYAVVSIFAMIVVAFIVMSEARHKYWKNDPAVFIELKKIYPDWHIARYYLGRHYLDRKEYDRALEELMNIRVNSPYLLSDVNEMIGIVYRVQGRDAEAEQYFKKAISIFPDNKA